jgi:hypothetical protein
MTRQAYSIEEIRALLTDRAEDVAQRYAPAPGSYTDGHDFWTLNPGRPDRKIGSFVIHTSGPRAGTFKDFASGHGGDLIDLIALALGCPVPEALREARRFLGLAHEAPEDIARRKRALAEAEARRRAAEAERAAADAKRARLAQALFLSARPDILDTPVGAYLRGRDIDLAQLPRLPAAIRYLPDCLWQEVDPETGEVREARLPAMVAPMVRGSEIVALHRTYLAIGAGGWGKAPVPRPKKVLGRTGGAAIRIWAGIGPQGGKPVPLNQAGPGQHVWISEGIEDALCAALALPEARVLAAYSLGNIARIDLPANVATVTIVADRDPSPDAQEQLRRAVEAHRRAGREVRVWQAPAGTGAKDLNDWWRQKVAAERGAA